MRINENLFSASVTAKHLSEAETCTRLSPGLGHVKAHGLKAQQ